jgi:hypothetical protein
MDELQRCDGESAPEHLDRLEKIGAGLLTVFKARHLTSCLAAARAAVLSDPKRALVAEGSIVRLPEEPSREIQVVHAANTQQIPDSLERAWEQATPAQRQAFRNKYQIHALSPE